MKRESGTEYAPDTLNTQAEYDRLYAEAVDWAVEVAYLESTKIQAQEGKIPATMEQVMGLLASIEKAKRERDDAYSAWQAFSDNFQGKRKTNENFKAAIEEEKKSF